MDNYNNNILTSLEFFINNIDQAPKKKYFKKPIEIKFLLVLYYYNIYISTNADVDNNIFKIILLEFSMVSYCNFTTDNLQTILSCILKKDKDQLMAKYIINSTSDNIENLKANIYESYKKKINEAKAEYLDHIADDYTNQENLKINIYYFNTLLNNLIPYYSENIDYYEHYKKMFHSTIETKTNYFDDYEPPLKKKPYEYETEVLCDNTGYSDNMLCKLMIKFVDKINDDKFYQFIINLVYYKNFSVNDDAYTNFMKSPYNIIVKLIEIINKDKSKKSELIEFYKQFKITDISVDDIYENINIMYGNRPDKSTNLFQYLGYLDEYYDINLLIIFKKYLPDNIKIKDNIKPKKNSGITAAVLGTALTGIGIATGIYYRDKIKNIIQSKKETNNKINITTAHKYFKYKKKYILLKNLYKINN